MDEQDLLVGFKSYYYKVEKLYPKPGKVRYRVTGYFSVIAESLKLSELYWLYMGIQEGRCD